MPFNDTINWPTIPDVDFPNLRDNDSNIVLDTEKFYAAHFNKVRNFVIKAYGVINSVNSVAGDGTFQKLSTPVTFSVSLNDLLKVGAFQTTVDSTKVPGNYLPFEFVITSSTDSYQNETSKSALFVSQATLAAIKLSFGSINPFLKVIAQAQITLKNSSTFTSATAMPVNKRVVCNVYPGTNTILIRGAIIDNTVTAQSGISGSGSQSWEGNLGNLNYLRVSLIGIE